MRVDRLVRVLEGAGVAAWSVYVGETRRAGLGTKDRRSGDPHAPLTIAESLTGRYRIVWSDGRVSRGAMERRVMEQEPEALLVAARQAAFEDADAREVLGPSEMPDVRMHDAETATIAGGRVDPFVPRLAAIRDRVERHTLRTWSGSMFAAEGWARVITSAGCDALAHGTSCGWSVTLEGEVGTGVATRAIGSLTDFEERLDRLVALAVAMRTEAPGRPGGDVPVLLHPDVVEDYVLGVLFHNLDGALVAHGTGAFTRSQFEAAAAVMREDLTLRVDPRVPMAAGTYRFSQEGLPADVCVFIEGGRLRTPVLDLKYARRLGMRPTAVPSAYDTVFLEGVAPLDYAPALEAAAGGALVLSVLGTHTQDFTSGDFSLSAPQTLALGRGGIDGRLRATISGNIFAALRSPELRLVSFPGEHTPGLLFRCRLDAA